ncbi:MAG: class I SAM-dependent methyltransferase [Prochloron sp. SP5CPC1]|nr:class I SAM-dependent methyltransferase [Candidatus Paraprochloron terpiosi SP5CPC1]
MNTDYLNFCPRLKEIIDTGTTVNSKGEKIKTEAISTLNNIKVIREILRELKPIRTLEIGLAHGASALIILSTLREISPNGFLHTAIDPHQTTVWGGSSIRVINDEGYSENFRFYEDYSAIVLANLVKEKEKFYFAYVDGSHLFENVFLDFYYTSILLNKGSIVLFDDCTDRNVAKVIKFINKNYSDILQPLNVKPFEEPQKPSYKKLGNLLGIRQLIGFRKIIEPPRQWNAKFRNF